MAIETYHAGRIGSRRVSKGPDTDRPTVEGAT